MYTLVNRFGADQGVFTTDREWMGNGWGMDGIRDNRSGAPGFYPDRIRVIRG